MLQHQVTSSLIYTQFAPMCLRLNVLSFVWPVSWKLWDSTVDDMLTYSLEALHVGAHVLFDTGCFYLRRDQNGLNVATHMDGEAPNQDRSRRSKWFTVMPREFIVLNHVSIATGRRRAKPGSLPLLVGPPAIRVLFCVTWKSTLSCTSVPLDRTVNFLR